MTFETMEFKNQLASLKKRLTATAGHIQLVAVRAHVEYAQKDGNPDFDAVARVLNTVKTFSIRTAQALARYFRAHGPYRIDYGEVNGVKKFTCKKLKDGGDFLEMTTPWNQWDNDNGGEEEIPLKGMHDLRNILNRVANDTDNKKYDEETVAQAVELRNLMDIELRKREAA